MKKTFNGFSFPDIRRKIALEARQNLLIIIMSDGRELM